MGLVSYSYGDTGRFSIIIQETPDGTEYHVGVHGEISCRTCHITSSRKDAETWIRTAERFEREAGVRPEQFVCVIHGSEEEGST